MRPPHAFADATLLRTMGATPSDRASQVQTTHSAVRDGPHAGVALSKWHDSLHFGPLRAGELAGDGV